MENVWTKWGERTIVTQARRSRRLETKIKIIYKRDFWPAERCLLYCIYQVMMWFHPFAGQTFPFSHESLQIRQPFQANYVPIPIYLRFFAYIVMRYCARLRSSRRHKRQRQSIWQSYLRGLEGGPLALDVHLLVLAHFNQELDPRVRVKLVKLAHTLGMRERGGN